jgi:hypothetical protein
VLFVVPSLFTVRTLTKERAAARGRGGIEPRSGKADGSGSGIGIGNETLVLVLTSKVHIWTVCLRLRSFKVFLAFDVLLRLDPRFSLDPSLHDLWKLNLKGTAQ